MVTTTKVVRSNAEEVLSSDQWSVWPVNWSAVWVGALAALAVSILVGLIAIAVGAHMVARDYRVVDLKTLSVTTMVVGVCGAFFAFVLGGWIAGKIAGILRSEPAMLHGAIVWLVATPLIATAASLGGGAFAGGWLAGLATPAASAAIPFERPEPLSPTATSEERARYDAAWADYREKVAKWNDESPKAARNTALLAVTALFLGLMGSVIGGWMACGEPMTLTQRHRQARRANVPA
jgi:hypothetical protein